LNDVINIKLLVHFKKFEIYNTGTTNVEYDFLWSEMAKNGEIISSDEFDVFGVEPSHAIILPGLALTITMRSPINLMKVSYQKSMVLYTRALILLELWLGKNIWEMLKQSEECRS
jgi:hypothetical protein